MSNQSQLEHYAANIHYVTRVAFVGIAVNVFLIVAKLVVGIVFNNLALISDAATSGADIFTSLLTIAAIFVSSPKRDKKYNYGHEKNEPLIVLFFSLALVALGVILAWRGIEGILNPMKPETNAWLIIIVIFSVVANAVMFRYGMCYAKKTRAEVLRAFAWQSLSNCLASVAVLAGLIASIFIGTNIIESIAVIIVACFIFKVAFDTFKPALGQLTDIASSEEVHNKIINITSKLPGIIRVDRLRTRMFGSQIFAELVIVVDGNMKVSESYALAGVVHDTLEADDDLHIKGVVIVAKPNEAV